MRDDITHTHTTLPPTEPLTNLDTPHPLHNEQGLLNSPYPFGQSKNSYIIFSKSSPLGSPSRRLMCYRSASHLIFHIHFPPMNRIQTDSDVIAHTQHSRFFFLVFLFPFLGFLPLFLDSLSTRTRSFLHIEASPTSRVFSFFFFLLAK